MLFDVSLEVLELLNKQTKNIISQITKYANKSKLVNNLRSA